MEGAATKTACGGGQAGNGAGTMESASAAIKTVCGVGRPVMMLGADGGRVLPSRRQRRKIRLSSPRVEKGTVRESVHFKAAPITAGVSVSGTKRGLYAPVLRVTVATAGLLAVP